MNNKNTNNVEESKKPSEKTGRKKQHDFLKLRTLIWYYCVRHVSKLKDAELDLKVVPKNADGSKREYIERLRIFESLRRSGASISNGKHAKRSYKLLELVEALPKLQGSKALYETPFWEYVLKPMPTLEAARKELIVSINKLELYKIKRFKDTSNATEHELLTIAAQLNRDYSHYTESSRQFTTKDVEDLLSGSIKTDKRGVFDDILISFASIKTFDPLVHESLNLNLLAKYFNFLHFSIVYYQYSMLTANLHAVIASSEWVKQLLSLLIGSELIGLGRDLTELLGQYTYALVFNAKGLSKQNSDAIFSEITGVFDRDNQELPLVKFIHAL